MDISSTVVEELILIPHILITDALLRHPQAIALLQIQVAAALLVPTAAIQAIPTPILILAQARALLLPEGPEDAPKDVLAQCRALAPAPALQLGDAIDLALIPVRNLESARRPQKVIEMIQETAQYRLLLER